MAANQMNSQFLQSAITGGAAGMAGGAMGGGGLFGGNAGSGFGGFQNFMARGQNQAMPDFVGAPYSRFN
jgi:hypothetical protein